MADSGEWIIVDLQTIPIGWENGHWAAETKG